MNRSLEGRQAEKSFVGFCMHVCMDVFVEGFRGTRSWKAQAQASYCIDSFFLGITQPLPLGRPCAGMPRNAPVLE